MLMYRENRLLGVISYLDFNKSHIDKGMATNTSPRKDKTHSNILISPLISKTVIKTKKAKSANKEDMAIFRSVSFPI